MFRRMTSSSAGDADADAGTATTTAGRAADRMRDLMFDDEPATFPGQGRPARDARRRRYLDRGESDQFWDSRPSPVQSFDDENGGGTNGECGGKDDGCDDDAEAAAFGDESDRYYDNGDGGTRYRDNDDDHRGEEEGSQRSSYSEDALEDDNNTSNKEDVVNAYKDYLKSIREGGFESYLSQSDAATGYDDDDGGGGRSEHHRRHTPDRGSSLYRDDVDVAEERRSSLYGNLYGIDDVRSPYAAWKKSGRGNREKENFRRCCRRSATLRDPRYRVFAMLCLALVALVVGLSTAVGRAFRGGNRNGNGAGSDMEEANDDAFESLVVLPGNPREGDDEEEEGDALTSIMSPNHNPNRPNGEVQAIKNAMRAFDPVWYNRGTGWEGIRFDEAIEFCASIRGGGSTPCPYEIYCNDGPRSVPYRGARPGGEQWAAVSNGPNQWVQVGGMFACERYTDLHDGKPEWGVTGFSDEHVHEHGAGGITQNILCCRDAHHEDHFAGGEDSNAAEADMDETLEEHPNMIDVDESDDDETGGTEEDGYSQGNVAVVSSTRTDDQLAKREKAVVTAFQPIWFSDAHGWTGTTYEDAILFCESYNRMVLCPYSAYCPNGPGRLALPGSMVLSLDGEEWAPANGAMNSWIQIGKKGGDPDTTCMMHLDLEGERPSWGADGTRRDVKHHVMCCLM